MSIVALIAPRQPPPLTTSPSLYEEKNVKFADAVMAFWGMDKGITTTYTYDEVDFKRIDGLTVITP